jgi:hypothetical protein
MQKGIKEPSVVFLMLNCNYPSNHQLYDKNDDKPQINSQKVLMYIDVVEFIKPRGVLLKNSPEQVTAEDQIEKDKRQIEGENDHHDDVNEQVLTLLVAEYILDFYPHMGKYKGNPLIPLCSL